MYKVSPLRLCSAALPLRCRCVCLSVHWMGILQGVTSSRPRECMRPTAMATVHTQHSYAGANAVSHRAEARRNIAHSRTHHRALHAPAALYLLTYLDLLGCRDVKQCLFAPPGIAIPLIWTEFLGVASPVLLKNRFKLVHTWSSNCWIPSVFGPVRNCTSAHSYSIVYLV